MANKNNFITNMKKQFGDNWIVSLSPEDIQRSGKRIFKEMVKGQFDYEQLGIYFLDGKFLDNLIVAASNELEINTLYYNALSFYMQSFPHTPNISPAIVHVQKLAYIYNVIYQNLSAVKQTGNIGYLHNVCALLYSYRSHLN